MRERAYTDGEQLGCFFLAGSGLGLVAFLTFLILRPAQVTPAGYGCGLAAALGVVVGFAVLRGALRRRAEFDPNAADEAKRARVAARRAIPVVEFHARVAMQNSEDFALAAAEGEMAQPFPLAVWVMRRQLMYQEQVPVTLPGGEIVPFALRNTFQRGDLYPLTTADGRPTPFAARLRVFHTTRRQRWSKP